MLSTLPRLDNKPTRQGRDAIDELRFPDNSSSNSSSEADEVTQQHRKRAHAKYSASSGSDSPVSPSVALQKKKKRKNADELLVTESAGLFVERKEPVIVLDGKSHYQVAS